MDQMLYMMSIGDRIPELQVRTNVPCAMAQFVAGTLMLYLLTPCDLATWEAAVTHGSVRLGVSAFADVMVMTANVAGSGWLEAPYTPHLTVKEDLPIENRDGCISGTLVLVDSRTGEILRLRPFGLSEEMSRCLRKEIRRLMQKPFSRDGYDEAVRSIQWRYTTKQLAEDMVQARQTLRAHPCT